VNIKEVIDMPFGDGTGPMGKGPVGPKGMGRGFGRRGRGAGPTGFCICPSCGEKVEHKPGIPCSSMLCPKCGTRMVRG
jgi:hypothetical protein